MQLVRKAKVARRSSAAGPVALGLCLLLTSLTPAGATILLFDQARDAATQTIVSATGSGAVLPPDYGDNVTGPAMAVPGGIFTYGEAGEGFTPNITLDLSSAAATPEDPGARLWQTGYGDLVNVVYGNGPGVGGAPSFEVLFTADPGFEVDLYGFMLAGFPSSDFTIAAVEVFSGVLSLYRVEDVLVEGDLTGPRHTAFEFAQPLSGSSLRLRLDVSNLASGIQDNIGLDSIRFGQRPPPIPEPSTAILVGGGLAVLGGLRRRASSGRAAGWRGGIHVG